MSDLTTSALETDRTNLALGNERFQWKGTTFVRNRTYPVIYDANHVTSVSASTRQEIERLLRRVEREYDGFGHRRFDVDFRTPPSFTARLALEGYTRRDALIMVLEGELRGKPPEHDIRPVTTDADWAQYSALRQADWREYREKRSEPPQPEVASAMVAVARRKQPPVQYWLAYADGRPAGYLNSWAGVDGVGQVEDLFTHPEFRHRGLATALIHHCVADCRRNGAEPVIIAADPEDTPKLMYATMGFRAIAIYSHYLKKIASDG